MATIIETYEKKFRKSAELAEKGRDLIPGGAHQSRIVRPFPIFVERAQGAVKYDVDGNELVDYMMGYGALLLGHANPKIADAVAKRMLQGTHMGTGTPLELRWAELVKRLIPSAERVRFTGSGTEATLLAIRLSRAYTGRKKLVKFREHFHGWHDYVAMESGINTRAGIPQETLSTVVVVEPKIEALREVLARDNDIACVIMEPTGGHWGEFPLPNPQFLHDVREVTARHGVLMIMDEVITGFRVSRGGAQARFDVRPDLTTLAKILAGGLPGGAVAGKADILDLLASDDPAKRMAHPGTYNANPLSATSGIACLEIVSNEPVNAQADAAAERLKAGLREALSRQEVTGHVHGVSSIVHVALGVECGCGGGICTCPHDRLAKATAAQAGPLKLAMLNEGIDTMGGIGFMVSAVHSQKDIDRTADAFERALLAMRREGAV